MKHLGDITKISGNIAPVVDVVIGGSPCQDLSLAGKRAGLDGERSGLFMEQIRIIKEMRNEDKRNCRSNEFIRPRYMVWENVYGAFSSNKGEDFRIVLEETAKVADENAVIPRPADGKWKSCGCIMADGWSIAWRVFDAQFWGVPQRRRRIALVADFGGQSAPEILFVRKGVSRDIESCKQTGEGASKDIEGSLGADDSIGKSYTLKIRSGCEGGGKGALVQTEKSATLSASSQDQYLFQPIGCDMYNQDLTGDKSATIGVNCGFSTGRNGVIQPRCITCDEKMGKTYVWEDQANTLAARDYKQPQAVVYPYIASVDCRNCTEDKVNGALQSNSAHSLNGNNVVRVKYIVRRITPLECERLQGFPDGWTDIGEWTDSNGKKRKTSDANRYKALGNSIALPSWKWLLKRLCSCYERDVKMASLFDGIGGFPYLWEQLNGKVTCLWASEIEDFPIAVTKKRIGGN